MGVLPNNCRQQTRSKVTQDREGESEDAQFRISDVPYLSMGRGHTQVHLRKGLEMT